MKTDVIILVAAAAALGAVVLGPRLLGHGGVADTPQVFLDAGSLTLNDAVARGASDGKPVLAVVTADWCPPCQALKRGALSDPEVAGWIGQHAIPVYLDADTDTDEARMLGTSSIPATYVIRGGDIVASRVGNASGTDYLAWLREHAGQ